LIVEPDILVLDEPTSALDVTMAQQILELLQNLQRQRGLSYLLISHDVAVVQAMAHSVIVMKDGKVVESGPVEEVLVHPRHAYTRMLLAASE
jgi:microcin C transport system ATP-binding protein